MNFKVNNRQNFSGINKVMTKDDKLKLFAKNLAAMTINGAKKEVNQYGFHKPYVVACESPTGAGFVKFAIEYTQPRKNEPDNIKSFVVAIEKNEDLISKNILKTGSMEEIEKFIKENDDALYKSLKGLLG